MGIHDPKFLKFYLIRWNGVEGVAIDQDRNSYRFTQKDLMSKDADLPLPQSRSGLGPVVRGTCDRPLFFKDHYGLSTYSRRAFEESNCRTDWKAQEMAHQPEQTKSAMRLAQQRVCVNQRCRQYGLL